MYSVSTLKERTPLIGLISNLPYRMKSDSIKSQGHDPPFKKDSPYEYELNWPDDTKIVSSEKK